MARNQQNKKMPNVKRAFYNTHLQNPNWTQTETDTLLHLHLAHVHELRWAVIHDRWQTHFGIPSKMSALELLIP